MYNMELHHGCYLSMAGGGGGWGGGGTGFDRVLTDTAPTPAKTSEMVFTVLKRTPFKFLLMSNYK